MNKYLLSCLVRVVAAVGIAFLSANLVFAQSLESQLNEFEKVTNSNPDFTTNERAAAVASGFDGFVAPFLSPERIQSLSETELKILFRAVDMTVFYTDEPKYVVSLRRIVEALEDRKIVTDEHYQALYFSLLQVRELNEADDFIKIHPLVISDALPKHSEAANLSDQLPTEWIIDAETSSLERRNVDIQAGVHIIVVSSPGCPFSRNAVRDISRDPMLMRAFDGHVKWLIPQMRRSHFSETKEWNSSYPNFKMTMAYKRQEWKEINHWGTPTFYFYKDGILSGKVTGWPQEGNQESLKIELKKIGLI